MADRNRITNGPRPIRQRGYRRAAEWSVRRADRAPQAVRNTRPTFESLMTRGAHAGEIAAKALHTAEQVTRREGADGAADALHAMRGSVGVLDGEELPIPG